MVDEMVCSMLLASQKQTGCHYFSFPRQVCSDDPSDEVARTRPVIRIQVLLADMNVTVRFSQNEPQPSHKVPYIFVPLP